jgi:hypothetical protein
VESVKTASLAEKAGVLPKDILCWHKGPKPIFFHDLLFNDSKKEGAPWELISEAEFRDHVKEAEAEKSFTFYVARKTSKKLPSAHSLTNEDSSLKGIVLTKETALKLETFPSLSEERRKKLLQDVKKDAKLQFEADRKAVLESLPDSVKQLFGQIGFAKWGREKVYFPVLILSPFDVPPGDARALWLQKYKAVSISVVACCR